MIIELAAGALSGAGFVAIARRQPARIELRVYALGLIIAALIYVGFAAFGGADRRWIAVEAAGLLPFAALAWLGVRHSASWLALGWVAHALWDTGLHLVSGTPAFVPGWYPGLCLGFDVVVGVAIALDARTRRVVAAIR